MTTATRPLLKFRDGVFFMRCDREGARLARGAGFAYSEPRDYWWTREWKVAAKLIQHAELHETAKKEMSFIKRSWAGSRAATAQVEIPAPEGLTYMPFQLAGISYIVNLFNHTEEGCGALLGDAPGLGKTIQVCGVLNADPSIQQAVIVVPASLKINWQRELSKWLIRPTWIAVATDYWPVGPNIVIVNYDRIHKFRRALESKTWDLLVGDEAHMTKNPNARRSQVFHAIPAKRRLYLTGTPIVNRPAELWPLISTLRPDVWKPSTYDKYVQDYCTPPPKGSSERRKREYLARLEKLQQQLRIYAMVRRLKEEVLTELPAKTRQVVLLPPGKASEAVKAEQVAAAAYEAKMFSVRFAVEMAKSDPDPEVYAAAIKALMEAVSEAQGQISRLRHATALAKVPEVISQVETALESGGKVVLFAHHHDVIDAYFQHFGSRSVKLTGQMGLKERQASVDRFQQDSRCRLFIGSIYAAGVGLTLTASSHVMFAELDWVPGQMTQAEDRCHRIGQHDNVLVQHLVLEGSLDAMIAERLVEKQIVIDAALDNEKDELAAEPIVPAIETYVTMGLTRRQVEAQSDRVDVDAVTLELEQPVEATNPIDAAMLAALRERPLDGRRAVLARRILRKYAKEEEKDGSP